MARDYVPANDTHYKDWLVSFLTELETYVGNFGMTVADLDELDAAKSAYMASFAAHQAAQLAANTATAVKNTDRKASEDILRPLVRRITNHPAMTDGIRAALGLKLPSISMTPDTGMGEDVPAIFLESGIGAVTVHFGTQPTNERVNGKPSWAKGCNVYRQKAGEDEMTLLAFCTSSPFVDDIVGPAADYSYSVRYRGTKTADEGRTSAVATIAAGGLLAA